MSHKVYIVSIESGGHMRNCFAHQFPSRRCKSARRICGGIGVKVQRPPIRSPHSGKQRYVISQRTCDEEEEDQSASETHQTAELSRRLCHNKAGQGGSSVCGMADRPDSRNMPAYQPPYFTDTVTHCTAAASALSGS